MTLNNIILNGLILMLLCAGCVVNSDTFEPKISYTANPVNMRCLPSSFSSCLQNEWEPDWSKELFLGLNFAKEFDLYRAITCYKRALYLAPQEHVFEIEYHIIEAYYLGRRFQDVIDAYEASSLSSLPLTFPPLKELLVMLYDSYLELRNYEKAERIFILIQTLDCEFSEKLARYQAVKMANFCVLQEEEKTDESLACFLLDYKLNAKSVTQAKFLNALLPGAGYWYVGQKQSALTSFIINTLFIYASYQFFDRGYVAAGVITASLEFGWYAGGINGAGIEARAFNESLYGAKGRSYLIEQKLFPVCLFSYAF